MDEATATPSDITWEDVAAVSKLMGVDMLGTMVRRPSLPMYAHFETPFEALEYLTAEEHPLEQKYASILRTKP